MINILILPGTWNYKTLNRFSQVYDIEEVNLVYCFLNKPLFDDFLTVPTNSNIRFYKFYEGLKERMIKIDKIDLIEKTFVNIGFGELILGDIHHVKFAEIPSHKRFFNFETYQSSIVSSFNYFLDILTKEKIDVVLYEGYNSHLSKVLYHLCHEKKIPIIYPFGSMFKDKITYLHTNDGSSPYLKNVFLQIKKEKNIDLSPVVLDLIKRVKNNESSYGQVEEILKKKMPESFSAKRLVANIIKQIKRFRKLNKTISDGINYNKSVENLILYKQSKIHFVFQQFKRNRNTNWYRKKSKEFMPGSAVYFMHYQPEGTTHGISPYFSDEISNIRIISLGLPLGMKLFVREHPNNHGRRGKKYFQEILKFYPNVELLSVNNNPIDIIKKASIVFTVSGTVCIESAIHAKPVIIFSNIYYNILPLVETCTTPIKLPYLINDLLNKTRINKNENDLKLVEVFLEAFYRTSFEFDEMLMNTEEGMGNENARISYDEFLKYINVNNLLINK